MLLATPFLLFAVGYWLFASRCPVFVSRCLVLVSRYSPACCSLRITYCTLFVIPYSLRTAQLSLLPSCLVSSADRCTSSRIVHPCSRCVNHVNLLLTDARRSLQSAYYSNHSTLIASHILFLVARRCLFKICCFLIADRFALLSSCFSLLFASHSVVFTRILLLADCCFLFLFLFF